MVSREHKRALMHNKLQLLRSVTNSHTRGKRSTLSDVTKYIEGLKTEVERMNKEVGAALHNSTFKIPLPVHIRVEETEKGFLINVFSEKICSGLLVFMLEAFEELGLDVLHARVSCSANFQLEALGIKDNEIGSEEDVDAQVVEQTLLQAIQNWNQVDPQE